tara:strand:- start:287 stop:745 length:459 start_codon:yes stop_codon:yes gene_type:complete
MPYRAYRIIFRLTLLKYYKIRGARIGSHTYLGPNVYLDVNHRPGKIIIGKNCYITRNCSILVHSDAFMGGPLHIFKKNNGNRIFGDVVIGDNVFIGFHSVVLPNVKIGNNSVIGAMTLVLDDVPAGSIVAGVPGKVVGSIYDKLDISVSNQK